MERQGNLGLVGQDRAPVDHQQGHLHSGRAAPGQPRAVLHRPDGITVYLREAAILGPLDTWLAQAFDPSRIEHTLASMEDVRPDTDVRVDVIRATLEECDRKLARHCAALEAGADPALVAAWSREVQAERITAQAQLTSLGTSHATARRMTKSEICGLIDALGGLLSILREADPRDKLEVYRRLGLRLTYDHKSGSILAETKPPPGMRSVCVRGPRPTNCAC
jgi:site-specific DNA recombinase